MKKPKINKFLNESLAISTIINSIRIQKEINRKLKILNLNLQQSLILLTIFFENDSKIRSIELQSILTISKGNISHCLSFLESKNLISRKLIKDDLRGFEFNLTSNGKKVSLSLINIFEKIEQQNDKKFSIQKIENYFEVLKTISS